MKKKWTIAALGATGVLALGAGVPALASGEAETTPPSTSSPDDLRLEFEERRALAEQEFADRLAEELGLDADEVAKAIEKVRGDMTDERAAEHLAALEERLAAAVEAGTLTQDQADTLLELAKQRADGDLGSLGGRGFGHHGFGRGPGHGFGWGLSERGSSGDAGSSGSSASNTSVAFTA